MSSREVFDTIPPGRVRDDRARPPRVRAVPARATGPAATGTATEAPASVFPGRARALPPRSTLAARRGSLPHPGRGRPAGARHATCRAFRSVPRDRSRSFRALARAANRSPRPRPRYARIGPAERARGTQTRAAECARFCFAARLVRVGNRKSARSAGVRARVGKNISFHFLCSARSLEKLRERNVASFSSRRETGSVSSTLFIMRTTRRGESVAFFPEQRERTNARRGETEPKRSSDVTRATVARGHSRSL